jgi:hypothetical protein
LDGVGGLKESEGCEYCVEESQETGKGLI